MANKMVFLNRNIDQKICDKWIFLCPDSGAKMSKLRPRKIRRFSCVRRKCPVVSWLLSVGTHFPILSCIVKTGSRKRVPVLYRTCLNVIAARESGRQDRWASPAGQRGVCGNWRALTLQCPRKARRFDCVTLLYSLDCSNRRRTATQCQVVCINVEMAISLYRDPIGWGS